MELEKHQRAHLRLVIKNYNLRTVSVILCFSSNHIQMLDYVEK